MVLPVVLFLVLKEKRPEETGAKMADIWIMRARNEAKTGGLHLLDLSSSDEMDLKKPLFMRIASKFV